MSFIEPTDADVAATKAACVKAHGHDRLVGVTYASPVDGAPLVEVLFADLDYTSASAYVDARSVSMLGARGALFEKRLLWPAEELLHPIREEWGAFDSKLEDQYRHEVGFVAGDARARPLTDATAPPGLDPKLVPAMIAEADGVRLWSVVRPVNGLAAIFRQPLAPIHSLAWEMLRESARARQRLLCPALNIIADHCVWTPDGSLRAHIERRPGRAEDLMDPFLEMGGQAAKTSARRF